MLEKNVNFLISRVYVCVCSNQGNFVASQSFEDDVYIRLPAGVTVCEIGALALISRTNAKLLSSLPVAASVIVSGGKICVCLNDIPGMMTLYHII